MRASLARRPRHGPAPTPERAWHPKPATRHTQQWRACPTASPRPSLDLQPDWAHLREATRSRSPPARLGGARPGIGSTSLRWRRCICRSPGCSPSMSRPSPACTAQRRTSLGERESRTPFVIGVAGSVAVGKSTTARILAGLLRRWPDTPRGFRHHGRLPLSQRRNLERRGILHRKGFPESYDRRRLFRFVRDVKSGMPSVRAPVYSHLSYDVVPGEHIEVHHPDVLIVEGLNVESPRAAAGRDDHRLDRGLLRLLGACRRRTPTCLGGLALSTGSSGFGRRRSPIRRPTSTGMPRSAIPRRASGRSRSGADQRAEPAGEHPADEGAARLVLEKGRITPHLDPPPQILEVSALPDRARDRAGQYQCG